MTTFTAPLKVAGPNQPSGNPQTDTIGYVHCTKFVSLDSTTSRAVITLPPNSLLTSGRGVATSAFSADVSALNVNFGNSSQATRYGVISVSAVGQVRSAVVSGATDFDNGGTIVITVSAVSTTTFTSGGVRAFVEYIVTE